MNRGLRNNLLLPLIVYLVAALFVTYPLVTQLGTHIAGAGYTDSFEYARLGWWGKYAVTHGLNPFYQSLFGYPDGFFSAVQWAQPLIYLPISLLGVIFNPVAAFNLWFLIQIILGGLTAYWLCLEVAGEDQRLPALLGGLIFMIFPAVQGHMTAGHVNPLSNYALPIVALCLYRIINGRGSIRTALIGALALLIMALGNFTFPVFSLLPLLLFGGLYLLLFRRDLLSWKMLRQTALMLLGGAILCIPFYIPLAADILAANRPAYLQEAGWVQYSADLLAFVAPSPFTAWTSSIAPEFSRSVLGTNSVEGTAYLGIAATVLALIAVIKRREARLWLVITLGCMLFSLGPILKVDDSPVVYTLGSQQTAYYQSQIVLPYALFQNLPFISVTRTPGRFNITTGLTLGVLAAMGLSELLRRLNRHTVSAAITAAITLFVVLEYQLFFPFPTTDATIPDYFYQLAQRDIQGAVFDIPYDDLLAQKQALWQQTAHQQPLIAGYISRRTPVDPAKLALLSNALVAPDNMLNVAAVMTADDVRSMLTANGIRVVVYHRELLGQNWAVINAWAQQLFGDPAYSDDRLAVYELTAQAKPASTVILSLSGSFDSISNLDGNSVTWLRQQADVYLYAPASSDYHLRFEALPALTSRRLQLLIDGQPQQAWQVDPPGKQIDAWMNLEAGFHTLQLLAPDDCTYIPIAPQCTLSGATYDPASCQPTRPDHCVSVGITQLHGESTAPELVFHELPVQLSEGVSLLGYRMPDQMSAGDTLIVVTEWAAAEKLADDYHLFVHIVDSSGQPVAQYDAVPGDQTYPTTSWQVPQRWAQVSAIPIPSDLPSGLYRVFVGWYRYPDLTRLQVQGEVQGDREGAENGLVFTASLTIH
ncbi:MAG: hypothetical protein KF726_08945 [Anaerolineae bacterium]|nr:hypothetical protein [Anaerolineae bacterium]